MFRSYEQGTRGMYNSLVNTGRDIEFLHKDLAVSKTKNETIIALLYLMQQANEDLRVIVHGRKYGRGSCNTETFEGWLENDVETTINTPVALPLDFVPTALFEYLDIKDKNINVTILEVTETVKYNAYIKNYNKIIEAVPGRLTELKGLSLVLQESPKDKVRVYQVNNIDGKGKKHIILMMQTYSESKTNRFMAMLPSIFPELFKGLPVDTDDTNLKRLMEFCVALGNNNPEKAYEVMLPKLTEMRVEAQRKVIENSASILEKGEKSNIEANITRYDAKRKEMLDNYMAYCKHVDEWKFKLMMLETKQSECSMNEVLDFIIRTGIFEIGYTTSSSLSLYAKNYLEYVNPDILLKYRENKNSFFYSREYSDAARTILVDAFIDNKIKIPVATYVELDFRDNKISGSSHTSDSDFVSYSSYIPHPHLARFNCWGNNERYIREALRERNYLQAIDQIIAALYNMSLEDSTVTQTFMNNISATSLKLILDLEDNKEKTIKQYLKEKQEREVILNEADNTN